VRRGPILLLAVLVSLGFWRYTLSSQFTFLEHEDGAYQVLPWYQVQARAWHEGEFPLWDRYVRGGQSLIGQMQPGAAFPLNWPLFLAPLKRGFIQLKFIHWHYALMHLLAALFMYALARELNIRRFGALFSGLAFALTGHLSVVAWPQMLNGMIWIPLAFLFLHRAARAPWGLPAWREAAMCGAVMGLAVLSGHHEAPLFTGLALVGLFGTICVSRASESTAEAVRSVAIFAAVGVVAILISAVQILPAIEYGQDALRWVGGADPVAFGTDVPYYVHDQYRMQPLDTLGIIIPLLTGTTPFAGLSLTALAAIGLGVCGRKPWATFYAALAIVTLFFTFGPQTIFHGWVYSLIPVADTARNAGRAIFVFNFALAILAAFGLDRFLASARDQDLAATLRNVRNALVGFAALTFGWNFWQRESSEFSAYFADQAMFAAFVAVILALLIQARSTNRVSRRLVECGLVGLLLLESGSLQRLYGTERRDSGRATYIQRLDEPRSVIEFLKKQETVFRYEVITDTQPVNFGAWHGLEDIGGYLASESLHSRRLGERIGWENINDFMNVVFTVAREPSRPNQVEVFADPSGWKVFRNENARARAWIEYTVACGEDGSARVVARTTNSTTVEASLGCPGTLLLSEFMTPGWQAWSGGEQLAVIDAYDAVRAVDLPTGRQTVKFLYQPSSVRLGALLSGLGVLVCAAVVLFSRRRET
jgi:hypothetical protein